MRLPLTTSLSVSLMGHAMLATGVLWVGPAVMDRPARPADLAVGGSVIVELVAPEPERFDQEIGDRREPIVPSPPHPAVHEPRAIVEVDEPLSPTLLVSAPETNHPDRSTPEQDAPPAPKLTPQPTLIIGGSASVVTASVPGSLMPADVPEPADGTAQAHPGVAPPDITPGAAWDKFFAGVHAAIEQAKRYPVIARRSGIEDRVDVSFVITGSGETAQLRVTAPSRYPILNRAAIETIERVERFPPPPLEAGREHVRLTVPLIFSLHTAGGSMSSR